MNYFLLESAFKKRTKFNYFWGRKQDDEFDKKTKFIYKTVSFGALLGTIEANFKENA